MKKVWFLYVDIKTLDNSSILLDQLIAFECNEDKQNLLFAVTNEKSYVERFFELHRREMFLVVERKMTRGDYEEYLKENPHIRTDFLLYPNNITMFVKEGKDILQRVDYDAILALHEKTTIEFSYDAWDDRIYEFYLASDSLKMYYDAFSKRLRKALDDMRLFEYIREISKWYNSKTPNDGTIYINEWALLREFYGEVLIGGGDYDDPYI